MSAEPSLALATLGSGETVSGDREIELLVPEDDVAQPELSIVIPALNEQLTMAMFIDWCKQGLAEAGVVGEILIVDSSTDKTAEIALSKGARVLKTPKRGLGRAYIDSLPFIRGKYVMMGDCDCTYDFRELGPFVAKFRSGTEFIMGSRFRGYIEPGSMPPLHRYLGTPVTTWILNVIFSSRFSDIHCGMRGIARSALERMRLRSQSWEYASEMVLKSVHMKLVTDEVPIRFLKDQEGRLSHHKRSGWFSPWAAAWINMRAMLIYGANFFLFRPGIVLAAIGLALLVPLSFGQIHVGPIVLSIHWMLLGLTLATLGLQCVYLGVLAQVFFDYSGVTTKRWFALFPYTRTVMLSAGAFATGLGLEGWLVVYYVKHGFLLSFDAPVNNLGVSGMFLMIAGFVTFTFTLLLHSTAVVVWRQ
ncbi:MAG: glycosyltransferase family 2 protein [Polyangiaceae bacterium]